MSRDQSTRRESGALGTALFAVATKAVRRAPRDLTITSAATLATLDRSGPQRVTDLAALEGVAQPAMTAVIRVLEESGLVERRVDPADKRVRVVSLTEAGDAYVQGRRSAGANAFVGLINQLTDEEFEVLAAALPALQHLAALETQDPEESQG